MPEMKIHRLFVAAAEPILLGMKKLQLPTPDELYSLELRARRARAREIGRLVVRGTAAVASALQRLFAHEPKGVRHA
jgi:hypothetical protein